MNKDFESFATQRIQKQ